MAASADLASSARPCSASAARRSEEDISGSAPRCKRARSWSFCAITAACCEMCCSASLATPAVLFSASSVRCWAAAAWADIWANSSCSRRLASWAMASLSASACRVIAAF
eukprot:9500272-Pyramimonas_sp.AAC.1